jgi:hypothetical protein
MRRPKATPPSEAARVHRFAAREEAKSSSLSGGRPAPAEANQGANGARGGKRKVAVRLLLSDTSAYRPTSPFFVEAAAQLAQKDAGEFSYEFCDEAPFDKGGSRLLQRIARRIARRPPVDCAAINRRFLTQAVAFRPDLILICKGAFLTRATLARVKAATGAALINYATDDPFNSRVSPPGQIETIPLYDLYVCTKWAIMKDVVRAGCSNVMYLPFGYQPSVHFPEPPASAEERRRFDSDVVFIGSYDRERIVFFRHLLKQIPSLKLALYGGQWNRSLRLRRYWRGFALGRDFRLALAGARIAVNLVRHANRDTHSMRSFELPACGCFMLAERADEHLALFQDEHEGAYFSSPQEFAAKVRYYLAHERERAEIAQAQYLRVTTGGHTYGDRLAAILAAAKGLSRKEKSVQPRAAEAMNRQIAIGARERTGYP